MQKASTNLVSLIPFLITNSAARQQKKGQHGACNELDLSKFWHLHLVWKRATLLCCARDTFGKVKTNLFYTANLIQSINACQDRQLRQSPPRHRQKALEKHAWHWQANISKHRWLQWVLVLRLQNNYIASECSIPILLWQTNLQFRHRGSMQTTRLYLARFVFDSKVRLLAEIFCARDTWQKHTSRTWLNIFDQFDPEKIRKNLGGSVSRHRCFVIFRHSQCLRCVQLVNFLRITAWH